MPRKSRHQERLLASLVTEVLDKLAGIYDFQIRRSGHPDWPALTADMPADIRAAYDAVEKADRARARVYDQAYTVERRLLPLRAAARNARLNRLTKASRKKLADEVRAARIEVVEFAAKKRKALARWQRSGAKLMEAGLFRRRGVYEHRKIEDHLQARAQALSSLVGQLNVQLQFHAAAMSARTDRLGLQYPAEFRANRACEVLRGVAQRVVDEPSKFPDGLDLDQLRLDAHEEAGQIVLADAGDDNAAEAGPTAPSKKGLSAVRQLDEDVLGSQFRTRRRRAQLLSVLPQLANKSIVNALAHIGGDGPSDSVISKDLKALRAAGLVHADRLDRTAKGDELLDRNRGLTS